MKYNIEMIADESANNNWTLISEKYTNLDTELIWKCPEGHTVYSTWRKMRDKWECPVCKTNKYKKDNHKIVLKKPGVKRVLALDQSSRITGYAILDNGELIDYGVFESQLDDEIQRGHALKEWLWSMYTNWSPDIIGLEGIQYQQQMGVTTFQTLARIQGILMEWCCENEVKYEICPTNTWRHHCGVKGRARVDKKRSMQLIAKKKYDISISEDEADAIGIGIYMAEVVTKKGEIVEWE